MTASTNASTEQRRNWRHRMENKYLTMDEVCEIILLHDVDADLLIEVLGISAEEILERFEDKIEIHFDHLKELGNEFID
jgi:coproporphyrinogen III oxidase-like Fe-S oxidoreductase